MLRRRVPRLHAAYADARLLAHALRHGLWRSLARGPDGVTPGQKVLAWSTRLPARSDAAEIVATLRACGLRVREGGNAFYLPPQPGLARVLGRVVEHYPPAGGFKVLRDFRGLDEAHYLRPDRQTRLRRWLIGTPRDQLVTANYLHRLGLGPRVWDLCLLRAGPLTMPAFVVEHVDGDVPTPEECGAFLRRLRVALAETELRITVPHWQRHKDFRCPGCNRNLLRDSSGRLQYIDFQNFTIRNPRRLLGGLAETGAGDVLPRPGTGVGVPAAERFAAVRRLLREHGLDVVDRLVIDVGCGSGALLHHALAAGAWWGLGFDEPAVACRAQAIAAALGFTRFDVVAARPGALGGLGAVVPGWLDRHRRESVVVLHGGPELTAVPPLLLDGLPWRALVCDRQAPTGRSGDVRPGTPPLSLILRSPVAGASWR